VISITVALTSSILLATSVFSPARAEGDPAAGAQLAVEWCARCHDVSPGGAFKEHPPSFAAISVYRAKDQIFGRIYFPPLHSNMPEIAYILTPQSVEDLVAYIVSLEAE